jgi:hypothetical protein
MKRENDILLPKNVAITLQINVEQRVLTISKDLSIF